MFLEPVTQIAIAKSVAHRGKRALAEALRGDTLKARAMRGSAWIVTGTGAQKAIQLGRNLVLTRLLFPEAFGLMALVGIVNQGLQMFSDAGINPSIIQNRRGDETAFLNTAWTVQVVRGLLLWLLACAAAWPVAQLYSEPMLAYLLPVASLGLVIGGFNSTNLATARRHITLGRLQAINLVGPILGFAAAVPLAWYYRSVWALVAAGLVGAVTKLVLTHTALPGIRNRFQWDSSAGHELLHFGKWILLSTIATLLATRGDRFILGKLISMELLGVYTVAFMIIQTPRGLLNQFARNIVMPAVSRRNDLTRTHLQKKINTGRTPLLLGSGLIVSGLIGFGDLIVSLLWDDRYHSAGWMAMLLAVGLIPEIPAVFHGRILTGLGYPSYHSIANWMKVLFLSLAIPAGFFYFGLTGIIAAIALKGVVEYCYLTMGLSRNKISFVYQDLMFMAGTMGIAGLILAVRYWMV